MEQSVAINKAYYFCGCTKEFLHTEIPKKCTCMQKDSLQLSRVITFQANRYVTLDGRILYPECGVKD
jgi:hypothetical protein